jgi:triphosphoribosyl-dephospho-CoA synthase
MLPIGLCAQLACIWEVSAPKLGNVHRHRDFDDAHYVDFLLSAAAIAAEMEAAPSRCVGETVLAAVRATRQVVNTNTNLGIILLFAPLATVPRDQPWREGLERILDQLDVEDSKAVFEAIRLANPSGLGHADAQDIHDEPTLPLRQVMALATERDMIALQYVNGFAQVEEALGFLLESSGNLAEAIVQCQLLMLTAYLDSLIARKRGIEEALAVREQARQVLRGDLKRDAFDVWLREQGHSRNPGTTADLIATALFAGLREGLIVPPSMGQAWVNGH